MLWMQLAGRKRLPPIAPRTLRPMMTAASTGPTPTISVRLVPEATTAWAMRASTSASCLDARVLSVQWQIGDDESGEVKTDASDATVSLSPAVVQVLREHLQRQAERRARWGSAWVESGYVFTCEDGSPLSPAMVTQQFERLAFEAGLPPIRLHDLRHSAASIMQMSGIASDASFDKICERRLPALQHTRRCMRRRAEPAAKPCDLRCHHFGCISWHDEATSVVAADDAMMQQRQRRRALARRDASSARGLR